MRVKVGLINRNIEDCAVDVCDVNAPASEVAIVNDGEMLTNNKLFQKFQVRDIVFLAVTAAVILISCAIMPLVAELSKVIFGIAQVVTGLQISLFTTVGLMKVRKIGSLTMILIFMGAIMAMMSLSMFFSNLFVALVAEWIIVTCVFRGYKSDLACFVAGALTGPLSLPVYIVWNYFMLPEMFYIVTANVGMIVGMTVAVCAISTVGALMGVKIGRELQKAGVLKKNGKV